MKLINKISTAMVVAALLLSVASCDLNTTPLSDITNESFWKTEDDIKGFLAGTYVSLRNQTGSLLNLGEARSEMLVAGVDNPENYRRYIENTLYVDDAGPNWGGFYSLVNSCNLIIRYAPGVEYQTEVNRRQTMAQAYAMRAYAYFVMTRTWGDLILRTDPFESTQPEIIFKERSSQADIFKLIKEDLKTAIDMFPDNSFFSGRCMWSKASTLALKGDVYLWTAKRLNGGTSDLQEALSALNEVSKADVGLLDNFSDVFTYKNKENREVLLSIHYTNIENEDARNNFFGDGWLRDVQVPKYVDEETNNILKPTGTGCGGFSVSELVRNQFSTEDTRRRGTFFDVYSWDEGFTEKKYFTSVITKCPGYIESGSRNFCDDLVIYRYADVLLMIAEAKNALGQDPSAEINRVRERAYKENFDKHRFVNGSQASNDDTILQERLFELAFECKRWWDLIRFDKAFDLVPSLKDRKGQTHLYLFPLDRGILDAEINVKQNPGYADK